jgi:hypothetical protein
MPCSSISAAQRPIQSTVEQWSYDAHGNTHAHSFIAQTVHMSPVNSGALGAEDFEGLSHAMEGVQLLEQSPA